MGICEVGGRGQEHAWRVYRRSFEAKPISQLAVSSDILVAMGPKKTAAAIGATAVAVAPPVPIAKRPKLDCAGSSGALQMPELPDCDSDNVDTRKVMQGVIPYVSSHMCLYLFKHTMSSTLSDETPLHERPPLKIGNAGKKSMSSYKPAWDHAQCAVSLAESGIYEAAGNIAWFNPEIAGQNTILPSEDVSWAWLSSYSDVGFQPFVPEGEEKKARIKFAFTLSGNSTELAPGKYPADVMLLGAHGHVWAWYLAVLQAMKKDDAQRVLMLLECGLTVTVSLTVARSFQHMLWDSVKYSEVVREATKVMVDNFVVFTRKIMASHRKLTVQDLATENIRFNGSMVNATMLKAITSLYPLLTMESMKLFGELTRRYGADMLAGSYGKLRLLVNAAKATEKDTSSDLLVWALQALLVQLLRDEAKPAQFTMDTFSKAKDGTPSWIQMCFAQRAVVHQMLVVVRSLAAQDEGLAKKIEADAIVPLSTPLLYHHMVPVAGTADDDSEVEIVGELTSNKDFVTSLSEKLPRAGVLVGEFLIKVHDGAYDDILEDLVRSNDLDAVLSTMTYDKMKDLGKDMQEIVKAAHVASDVVGTLAGPPKASLRELVRRSSEAGDHDRDAARVERADVWKRAVAQRKKLITLLTVKDSKKAGSYTEAFRKCGACQAFKGVIRESHRLFVMSSDLVNQQGDEPWLVQSKPDEKVFAACLEFLKAQRDPGDMIAAFDGVCGTKVRRDLEDALSNLPSTAEIFMVYDRSWNDWIAGRKHFMMSKNTEVGYVTCAGNRSKLKVQERSQEVAKAGEESSHWTSYTGVVMPPRASLAQINATDKAQIFPAVPKPLPNKWVGACAGVPLFWGETKSTTFWRQVISEHCVKAVVDLTPGSGALAEACMHTETPYVGFCGHQQHMAWLANVIDRAALKFITKAGTVLYQEDLATHLQELFSDALEEHDEVNDDHLRASDAEDDL